MLLRYQLHKLQYIHIYYVIRSKFVCFSNIIERYKTIGNLNLLISQNDQVIVLQPSNEISYDLPYDDFFSCFKDTGNLRNLSYLFKYCI